MCANILNVFSGEIHDTEAAIADVIFVGFGEVYMTKKICDVQRKFMCPTEFVKLF
ncbi:MAG TPA: hypothetical protein VFI73_13910 [Candidatus Nitrosopolaris sp.]|nr:hypothetical protein [Candidatus Nitrosopolaris sp.]